MRQPKEFRYLEQKARTSERGKKSVYVRAALVSGPRRVDKNCVDVSKREVYARTKVAGREPQRIEALQPFMPEHDFQRDDRYLELTRKLTYFDIECAKRLAMGDTVTEMHASMFEGGFKGQRYQLEQRVERRAPVFTPLLEYFRELLGHERDPNTFSIEEAFGLLVRSVRDKDSKQFDIIMKFAEVCGMRGKLEEYARSRFGLAKDDVVAGIDEIERMVGLNGAGAVSGDRA